MLSDIPPGPGNITSSAGMSQSSISSGMSSTNPGTPLVTPHDNSSNLSSGSHHSGEHILTPPQDHVSDFAFLVHIVLFA